MRALLGALWAEALKARRSMITVLTAGGFMLLPLAAGLFMVILKDPDQARSMGLISQKARLTAGTADWPSFFNMLAQGYAGLGAIVFTLITTWVYGREFSDRTVKELLALPTSRSMIVGAKAILIVLWSLGLTLAVFGLGLAVGTAVGVPGWTDALGWRSFSIVMSMAVLTIVLMAPVAFVSSVGRGYLLPVGWTVLTLALANLSIALGWGDWFPWAVPLLLSRTLIAGAEPVGLHGFLVVLVAFLLGTAATLAWWRGADQTR